MRRKQHGNQTTTVQHLCPGLEPAWWLMLWGLQSRQQLPLQHRVSFAHVSSACNGKKSPNAVALCLSAMASLGCCESSKQEGLVLFVCSCFSLLLFLRVLLALQIPISQSAFFQQDRQRHSKLATFITNAQAG